MRKKLLFLTFLLIGMYAKADDKAVLEALYEATDGANWTNTWDLSADMSTWHGVTVNASNRVTALNLFNNKLTGTLPLSLWELTELVSLNLSFNSTLVGVLPADVANLTKLKSLKLNYNGLSGAFPSEIFTLTTLETLKIGRQFEGSLEGIENLVNLKVISLDGSKFNTLPDNFWTLTGLEEILISNLSATSTIVYSIPASINQFTNLKKIAISGKNTAIIPNEITSLTSLTELSLRGVLTGNIPQNISNLTALKILVLGGSYSSNEGLTGEIPVGITNLTKLIILNLSGNKLTGVIPENIGDLVDLLFFGLSSNSLDTEIPSSIENLTKLRSLYLSNCGLKGSIPLGIANITPLEKIELHNNNLEGEIPDLTSLSNLNALSVKENKYVFEDLEPNFVHYSTNINSFQYMPQDRIDNEESRSLVEGEQIQLSVEDTQSVNNNYQWKKDGVNIDGATDRIYTINNVSISDAGKYKCYVSNSIVTGMELVRNSIMLDVTLHNEATENIEFKVYPNPASDKIVLDIDSAIINQNANVTLYGVQGNLIFQQKNISNNNIIDISELSAGIYILKLKTENKIYTSRIVKL